MSDEFTKLFEIGVKKYVENNLYEPLSEKTYALSVLTEHLWGRNEQYRYDDYQVEQRYIFADHILQCSSSISEDVVSYRTDDEKCIYDAELRLTKSMKDICEFEEYWGMEMIQIWIQRIALLGKQ